MNNEVSVRCIKDGISVEGARDIGSTSDTRAGSLSQFLRIAECWWFTYCEKSPIQEANCYGNAAAMREALMKAIILLKVCEWPDDTPMKDVAEVIDEIEKASCAPQRNCDRFGGDIDKLREACLRERGLNPEEDFPDVFPEWLLAPMRKCNGGDCIRARLCAEPCTDCQYCDEEGNL